MAQEIALFIGYPSCTDDGRYCERPELVSNLIQSYASRDIVEEIAFFEEKWKTSFFREISECTFINKSLYPDLKEARSIQRLMFYCVGSILRSDFDVLYLSGYSSGYGLAHALAGSIRCRDIEDGILPAVWPHVKASMASRIEGTHYTTIVYDPDNKDTKDFISQKIRSSYTNVVVKDDRGDHAVQLVGPEIELKTLRLEIDEFSGSAAKHSTALTRAELAHTCPGLFTDIIGNLKLLSYGPIGTPIIGHSDNLSVSALSNDRHAQFLFDGFVGFLNMGRVNRFINDYDIPLVLIASPRISRFMFYGCNNSGDSSCSKHHWEDLFFNGGLSRLLDVRFGLPAW